MLAERENELVRLHQLLEATSESGHVVAVGGEAGIGKSALISEFVAQLSAEYRCIWGMCDALSTPRPLGPVHDIAAALAEPEHVWQVARANTLFTQLFAKLSDSKSPVVLIIEDAHWADLGTLDFIRFLGRRISLCRVLMIVSFRSDELGRSHPLLGVLGDIPSRQLERIELQPLSLAAITRLTNDSGGDAASLMAITGGNPFFLTEILASEDLGKQIPVSVQDAVNSRLLRLSQLHRKLLELLSVIPVPVDPDAHCRWIDGCDQLLQDCLDAAILVENPDGRIRFRHELARLATSKRCSSVELRNLHRQHLATMLTQPDRYDAGELLHHARGAGDAAQVLHFAPIAAQGAAQLGSHKEAADYLESALDYVDEAEPEEAARLYESWAYEAAIAHRIDDRVIEARRHALTMWRALNRADKVAENLRHLSRLHWYRGEAVQANRYLDEAIRLLEQDGDSPGLALAYSLRSQMHMLNSQMVDAIIWGERALAHIGANPTPEVEVHALNNIGTAQMFLGDAAGIENLKASLALALEHNLHEDAARVFTNLSEYAIDLRRLDLAEQIVEQGLAYDTEHDLDSWTFYLLGRKAQLRLEQGQLAQAETICRSVLSMRGQTLLMKLPARIMLARTQIRIRDDEAGRTLKQAHKDALATGEIQYCIPVLFAMLEKAWLSGSDELAREAFEGLDRIDTQRFSLWSRAEYSFWAHLLAKHVPASEPAIEEVSATAFGRALAGDYSASGFAFARLGADYLANLCFALSDHPRTVSAGLSALHNQGAKAAVAKLTELLEDRGLSRNDITLPRGPYRSARENPFGLTAKEMLVLEYLADGHSNARIADEMSRSQRTIEHHVSSILQKLDAENRLEVLVKLRDEPWILGDAGNPSG